MLTSLPPDSISSTAPRLLPYLDSIFELLRRCLRDEDKTDATMRLSYGILGDLACTFPHGQINQHLSAQWITTELRSKSKMPGETKKISKWAREVSIPAPDSS